MDAANRMTTEECEQPRDVRLCSACVDWFSEGEAKTVEYNGLLATIQFVGRKGRRGRISITAPAGAVFRGIDVRGTVRPQDRSA